MNEESVHLLPTPRKKTGLFVWLLYFIALPLKFLFPSRLKLEQLSLSLPNWPQHLSGLKIVHLSDFHWDWSGNASRLEEELIERVIRETKKLQPDLILLTGDYVQRDPEPSKEFAEKYLSRLLECTSNRLEGSHQRVFAVLGNHDYKRQHSAKLIKENLEAVGIKVLDNQLVSLFPNPSQHIDNNNNNNTNGSIALVGLGDFRSGNFEPTAVFPVSPATMPVLCMSHNPDSAAILRQWRCDLILSGHTHGGQVCIPGYGPVLPLLGRLIMGTVPSFLTRRFPNKVKHNLWRIVKHWEWATGLHKVDRDLQQTGGQVLPGFNYLYTNRGLATHPPLRLFCDPEITYFEIYPL